MQHLLRSGLFAAILLCPVQLFSQLPFSFIRETEIPVKKFGGHDAYNNPWTGGFNAPQFGTIHLDDDSIPDLIVFDRSGNKWLSFLAKEGGFIYAPEYEQYFPSCEGWVCLRDFNNDGRVDLFTSALSGISVYRNTSQPGAPPSFELHLPLIFSNYGSNSLNLFVSEPDYPAIADIDGDGDLDILTFYILGTCVEYHRNLSVEERGQADVDLFRLESDNWGIFTESPVSNQINYNDSCDGPTGARHSGSTLLLHDLDNDSDMDLLLGDISFPELLALRNVPVNGRDIVVPPDDFPEEYKNFGVQIFPAGFVLDGNFDGIPDLVLAPNTDMSSLNSGNQCIMYPSTEGPFRFTGTPEPFICDASPDLGLGSYPVFADLDGDGALDILSGTRGEFFQDEGTVTNRVGLSFFRNTGDNLFPQFELVDKDFAKLQPGNYGHLAPAVTDLNNDGWPDIIVGTLSGDVLYLQAYDSSGTVQYRSGEVLFNTGDLYATPAIIDYNEDGLTDIIVGGRSGKFSLFLNNGLGENPSFNSTADRFNLGSMETIEESRSNFGYSAPSIWKSPERTLLISGSEQGILYAWEIKSQTDEHFPAIDTMIAGIDEGSLSAPSLADFNGDGFPEMICGNKRGGFSFFKGSKPTDIMDLEKEIPLLFPNPAFDRVTINGISSGTVNEINVYSATGILCAKYYTSASEISIPLSGLSGGFYLVRINNPHQTLTLRLLKY